jgi:hypothetical protein
MLYIKYVYYLTQLEEPIKVLIAFTPLLTEEDMSSESHEELLQFVLNVFGKDLRNVICLVGTIVTQTRHLLDYVTARLLGVQLIALI